MSQSRFADLSLDLDNQWSYMKTHGDAGWQSFPSYLDRVVPLFLDILQRHNLTITVFVVGQDAALKKNHQVLRSIVQAGHEIGNHSFHHEPWLQRYSLDRLREEFDRAEAAIANITDQRLVGFRGPGYSMSQEVLDLLSERGYEYDGSTLPTFIGPLARAYYFFRAKLSDDQIEDRQELFGSISDGLRSLKPYRLATASGSIIEIPVTTMPLVRAPIHLSYLLYLLQFSSALATSYFRFALSLCKLTGTAPSLLLHPLDFLGGDEIKELDFFPAMNMPGERKREFVSKILGIYASKFTVVNMQRRADSLQSQTLRQRNW